MEKNHNETTRSKLILCYIISKYNNDNRRFTFIGHIGTIEQIKKDLKLMIRYIMVQHYLERLEKLDGYL